MSDNLAPNDVEQGEEKISSTESIGQPSDGEASEEGSESSRSLPDDAEIEASASDQSLSAEDGSLQSDDSSQSDEAVDSQRISAEDGGLSSNDSGQNGKVGESQPPVDRIASRLRNREVRRETSVDHTRPSKKRLCSPDKKKRRKRAERRAEEDAEEVETRQWGERAGWAAGLLTLGLLYVAFFGAGKETPISPFLGDTLVPVTKFKVLGYGTGWHDSDAKRLFRQYARMRALCWHVSSELGFSIEMTKRQLPDAESTRPLNGQPGAPFFCLNALLDQFAAGEIYTVHEQQQHRNKAIERLRTVLPTDNIELARQMIDFISARRDLSDHAAPDVMQPFASIDQATNTQLGYLEDAVIARDLTALEYDTARLHLVGYEMLQELALTLHRAAGTYQDSACVCGLYYGLARSMVVTRHHNRTYLLLEPEIVRVSGTQRLLSSADLPWHEHPIPGIRFKSVSDVLFAVSGVGPLHSHLYHEHIDAVSVALTSELGLPLRVSHVRKLMRLSGAHAMCVQHCAALASAWADAADDFHLLPSERLVV